MGDPLQFTVTQVASSGGAPRCHVVDDLVWPSSAISKVGLHFEMCGEGADSYMCFLCSHSAVLKLLQKIAH